MRYKTTTLTFFQSGRKLKHSVEKTNKRRRQIHALRNSLMKERTHTNSCKNSGVNNTVVTHIMQISGRGNIKSVSTHATQYYNQ